MLQRVSHLDSEFQSLFFWMLLSKYMDPNKVRQTVMFQSLFFWMLLSKQAVLRSCPRYSAIGFNPYFSGCFSLRCVWSAGAAPISAGGFNPYFSGCFSLSKVSVCAGAWLDWFQSLFFWMLLSKVWYRCREGELLGVSILIFLDASL